MILCKHKAESTCFSVGTEQCHKCNANVLATLAIKCNGCGQWIDECTCK